jgi:DNA-binding beta-propeller fold protein YncE
MALTPDGKAVGHQRARRQREHRLHGRPQRAGTIKFEVKGARAEDISPVGITMSRDGKRAFVALGRSNHVAFSTAGRKVTDLVLVGKRPWNVSLDKAEARLWVVNGLSDDVTRWSTWRAKAIKSIGRPRAYGVVVVE